MGYYGVYAQHLLKFGNGKFVLNDGIRLQAVSMHSTIEDNSFFQFPFTSINQDNLAVTGNLGLVYLPRNGWRINAGISTGFRAPNIDDLARIFESNTASRQLIVPNPVIGPEYTYNFDLGMSMILAEKLKLEAGGFYTLFRKAIALAPFQLNGEDSVLYNGSMSRVYANQNINRAYVYGFHAQASADLSPQWSLFGTVNYTYGRLKPSNKGKVPLDHIPPVYGKASVAFNQKPFQLELYTMFNGWKKIDDYNLGGEDNAQYATVDGTPSWMTLNFKSTIKLHHYLSLQLGVENILDRNYRYFASGFSAPGRNWIFALRSNF
jgi:hemoglobin/transferrin/lactoferrin receptor protein